MQQSARPDPHILQRAPHKRSKLLGYIMRNKELYILLFPGVLFFLIFKYVPLLGSIIAFKDYNIFKGFIDSPWVGWKWFEQLFTYPHFGRLMRNTILISLYLLVFAFPAPIILASLLNEVRNMHFKRWVQTIVYLPHFLSWPIVFGLCYMLLSPQTGLVNTALSGIGLDRIHFLQEEGLFRSIIVTSAIWKEMGWNSIIFLAALAGINPSLYEAAKIDGAGRWKQYLHVTLPGIMPALIILLLLRLGNILDLSFEQIFLFLNSAVYNTGDVLDTYTFRMGIMQGQYSLTTAIGIFKSVVGFVLLVVANRMSKAFTGESLY